MRKLSLMTLGLILTFSLAGNFAMGATEVKVGKGDLKIGGILQAGFTYNVEDETGFDSFTLNRARFLFWGTIIPDKVKYFVQLDHRGGTSVLDYKAQFFYIEKTEIAVGRFLPNFTVYMPLSTAKLEMINYPLTTLRFAVWRQVGIQSTTKTDYVDFNLGIFNGYPANNFTDDNDAKDFFGRVEIKPPIEQATVRFGGYGWIGSALPSLSETVVDTIPVENADDDTLYFTRYVTTTLPEETLKRNRFGGFATVDYTKDEMTLRFRGEFLMAESEKLTGHTMDDVVSVDAQAFFAHVGIQPRKEVEFLARYDFHDPNTDMDDDGETWITGGVNYYMEGINAMLYLNYIHKMEQGDEIDNDLVQAQVQISF